jgi:hypothetical protein
MVHGEADREILGVLPLAGRGGVMAYTSGDAKKWLDDRLAQMKRDSEIHCPFCDYLQSSDDQRYPVSYHGHEDGPEEMECDSCRKTFFVEERVIRNYVTGKTREECEEA